MSYTKAQVGAANTPDIHLTDDAPDAQHVVDFTGDEFDSLPVTSIGSASRNWRARPAQLDGQPGIALGTDQTTRANEHAHAGQPDPRRTETALGGNPSAPELASLSPSPETPHNDRDAVALRPEAAPARARQGFTGEDPARAAQSQRAWFLRPFDQWAARHPGTVEKVSMDNPTAARPPERGRLRGALPSPSGAEGTGMEAVGAQPNTFRLLPRRWDEQIVNTGPEAAPASARARGWRL